MSTVNVTGAEAADDAGGKDLKGKSFVSFTDMQVVPVVPQGDSLDEIPFGQRTTSDIDNTASFSVELPEKVERPETVGATDVVLHNPYRMGPTQGNKFPLAHIRVMLEYYLGHKLTGKTYNQTDAAKLVTEIADEINLRMKGNCLQERYKHVVNVMIYQQTGAGCFYGARAIWDGLTDDYLTYKYETTTFTCICTIFGIYQY